MRTESREVLAIGIFGRGTCVGDRIEMLLLRGRTFSPRASGTDVIASLLVLGFLMLGASLVPRWITLEQQNPAIAFEVASIHANTTGSPDSIVNLPDTGRLSVTNATLETLIRNAYGMQKNQIVGAPKWIDSDRYDIQAKTAGPIREADERPLLQNLLGDRFRLKIHQESRNLPIYALRLGKGGPKSPEHKGDAGAIHTSRGAEKIRITAERFSMSQLAGILNRQLDRVVDDKTGLQGYYDFSLEWDPNQAPDSQTPSLFAALEEQMGLKLEASRGSVPVLVIDHAEKPHAN
ncbi:MAG TPA: TIGR03435 family protein [Bryobacteraceae bacterium]|nr:TIGR03435 family protein [Bryobacteraceae bacterium]